MEIRKLDEFIRSGVKLCGLFQLLDCLSNYSILASGWINNHLCLETTNVTSGQENVEVPLILERFSSSA